MSAGFPNGFLTIFPAVRGKLTPSPVVGLALGVFRLDSDAIGTFTLRLRNLVAGSRVRVETQASGVTLDEFVASAADQDRTLSLYASGNANNDIRIKVRHASGTPAYRPFETLAVAQLGVVTVFVSQELDE